MIGRRISYALVILTLAGCSPSVTPARSTTPSPPIPKALRSTAITFCTKDDEVCNWPPGGYSGQLSETHRHFYETHATQTGEQLADVLTSNGL